MATFFQIDLEILLSVLNIILALILFTSAVYAKNKFGLAIYKTSWYLFMIVSVLMIAGSVIRLYISFYDYLAILWIPRFLDFVERFLLIVGIYMLASITAKLWGDN